MTGKNRVKRVIPEGVGSQLRYLFIADLCDLISALYAIPPRRCNGVAKVSGPGGNTPVLLQ